MDIENGKKTEVQSTPKDKLVGLLPVLIRLAALLATVTACVVMGLNKQTKTIAVAMVGTNPLFQTFTAKFQQTPAFVYFVIANAIASFYNLVVLLLKPYAKLKANDVLVHLLDMVTMTLVATGVAAAASMAQLGKNGNSHARWNPICDRFGTFCLHGGLALVASLIGASLLLILNVLSMVSLHKNVAASVIPLSHSAL